MSVYEMVSDLLIYFLPLTKLSFSTAQAKPGIWMNVIAVIIQLVCVSTFGRFVYTLNEFPDWAMPSNATVASHYIG